VRDAITWKNTKLPYKLSDAFLGITSGWALGTLTASAAADHRLHAVDPLLVVESTTLAMMVNQIVKMEVARKRPDAPGEKAKPHPQHNMSFFSGHATWSFSSAVSAGTVAILRGYRGAPAVLGGGLALATATCYFRLAANRHWISDVITGAAFGSLVGAIVPRLHLVPNDAPSSATSAHAAATPTMFTMGGGF
jgi:membrane-associated phospholipid phosphatase